MGLCVIPIFHILFSVYFCRALVFLMVGFAYFALYRVSCFLDTCSAAVCEIIVFCIVNHLSPIMRKLPIVSFPAMRFVFFPERRAIRFSMSTRMAKFDKICENYAPKPSSRIIARAHFTVFGP